MKTAVRISRGKEKPDRRKIGKKETQHTKSKITKRALHLHLFKSDVASIPTLGWTGLFILINSTVNHMWCINYLADPEKKVFNSLLIGHMFLLSLFFAFLLTLSGVTKSYHWLSIQGFREDADHLLQAAIQQHGAQAGLE